MVQSDVGTSAQKQEKVCYQVVFPPNIGSPWQFTLERLLTPRYQTCQHHVILQKLRKCTRCRSSRDQSCLLRPETHRFRDGQGASLVNERHDQSGRKSLLQSSWASQRRKKVQQQNWYVVPRLRLLLHADRNNFIQRTLRNRPVPEDRHYSRSRQ